MIFPFPHRIYDSVTAITPEELRALGVRGLLLDIDGTLMQSRDQMPAPAVLAWLEELRTAGVILYIFSNNRHFERVKAFAEAVGLPWTFRVGKPRQKNFHKASRELGLAPQELAVVGDQTYTDMLGARLFGCRALLVQSSDTYLPYFWPRRLAELPFRRVKP